MLNIFSNLDYLALAWFFLSTLTYSWYSEAGPRRNETLTAHMDRQREEWFRVLLGRELRIVDTTIITGLQNGTAFFASASLIGIGGCFALLGATEQVSRVMADLSFLQESETVHWELKVIGLLIIFSYAFFKFGWSIRLWNYVSILIGAIPMPQETDNEKIEKAMQRALKMNKVASQHFNRGLRAFFYSLAFIGWFIGPIIFMLATTWITVILYRRQFASQSRQAASYGMENVD